MIKLYAKSQTNVNKFKKTELYQGLFQPNGIMQITNKGNSRDKWCNIHSETHNESKKK